jgi:protein-S-isoprenylcysteine O-methyltransferase Ste14
MPDLSPVTAQALYGLAWISFGAGHSILALHGVRRRVQRRVGGAERLVYNVIATIHIAAVFGVGFWLLGDASDFDVPAWMSWGQTALAGAGLLVLAVGLRQYDLGRFGGGHQLRHGPDTLEPEDPERAPESLVTDGLHRYVRHPLYSGGMALLWGLAQSPLGLATAAWGTIYFLIGTWAEERKLLRVHGAAYRAYRRRVPAFIPWKGRAG